MGKTGSGFDPEAYAPVAERIRLFYRAHPLGRIHTELVRRDAAEVVFKALVYRDAADDRPSATGWAAEREGDGDINTVACLENTETSAIGRALANLGFTAARERPSAEEMAKASRARARLALSDDAPARVVEMRLRPTVYRPSPAAVPRVAEPPAPASSPHMSMAVECTEELLRLLDRAQRLGVRAARIVRWREQLGQGVDDVERLHQYIRRLRGWIALRQAP